MWEVRKNPPGVVGQRDGRHLFIQVQNDSDAEWLAEILESATDTVVKLHCINASCPDVGGYITRTAADARKSVHACDSCGKPMVRKASTSAPTKIEQAKRERPDPLRGIVPGSEQFAQPSSKDWAPLMVRVGEDRTDSAQSPKVVPGRFTSHDRENHPRNGEAAIDFSAPTAGALDVLERQCRELENKLSGLIAELDNRIVGVDDKLEEIDCRIGELVADSSKSKEGVDQTFSDHGEHLARIDSTVATLGKDVNRLDVGVVDLTELAGKADASAKLQIGALRDMVNALGTRISDLDKRTSIALNEIRASQGTVR